MAHTIVSAPQPPAPVPRHTIHATALVIGCHGILIRGRSGAGKSALALALLGRAGANMHAALVSDDRTALSFVNTRLIARRAETIASLMEVRGLGIARAASHAAKARITLIVDLVRPEDAPRFPQGAEPGGDFAGSGIEHLTLPVLTPGSASQRADIVLAALGLGPVTAQADMQG